MTPDYTATFEKQASLICSVIFGKLGATNGGEKLHTTFTFTESHQARCAATDR